MDARQSVPLHVDQTPGQELAHATSRSRRSLLAAAAAAAGALATQAVTRPLPVSAASVTLGAVNTTSSATTIRNTQAASTAKAIVGIVTTTGAGGTTAGVQGQSKALDGRGVFGLANSGTGAKGVHGHSTDGAGVFGDSSGTLGTGVAGIGPYRGVYGESATNFGVWGQGYTGVAARGSSVGLDSVGAAWGLYAQGPTYAGYFSGNVHIEGTLSGGSAGFRIDHPLAPGARSLEHSYVDAPERVSVYRGTVTLDAQGAASVRLPRYVSELNHDFSYQLTALDGPAPGVHVARRMSNAGSFRIEGGGPGQQVCWLVTGSRMDPWARAHPLRVERRKGRKDQGKYLNPELFGEPRSAAIGRPPRPRNLVAPTTSQQEGQA